jgi:nucleoside-diphosphate-sugar epimerase
VSGVVLVTGAGGFVGRHAVADLIARGFTVHGVGRKPSHDDSITWHQADLLDDGARAALLHAVRPSHLFHLAWETRHGYFWSAPENPAWAEATLDLIRRFQDGGGRRAVVAGSCAEYDWSLNDGDCFETTTPCRPATPYGRAKLATFEAASEEAAASGLSLAWGRLFLLYGPHEGAARLVSSLIRAMLAGEPVALKEPTALRDFLHAADGGAAFGALVASDVEGPVNIASGRGVAIADVARMIGADVSGADAPPDGSPARLVADVSRLRDEVGFTPRYNLESGLTETVAWWRDQS